MTQAIDIPKITRLFEENLPDNVLIVLLFGSSADGIIRTGSDLDFGIYLDNLNTDLKLEIISLINDLFERNFPGIPLDIVFLNDAGPLLRYEALRGRLLFIRNMDAYSGFFSLTCREYEDEIRWMERKLEYRGYGAVTSK